MPSERETRKRALVSLLRSLGQAYGCHVSISRSSTDQEVRRAFRAVALKVHPDKPGGSNAEFQKLSAAHDAWADLVKSGARAGRPPKTQEAAQAEREPKPASPVVLPEAKQAKKEFRINRQAVLLTYQGYPATRDAALSTWARFLGFIRRNLRNLG